MTYADFGPSYVFEVANIGDYVVPSGTTAAAAIVESGALTELWFSSAASPTDSSAVYTQWDLSVPITG